MRRCWGQPAPGAAEKAVGFFLLGTAILGGLILLGAVVVALLPTIPQL